MFFCNQSNSMRFLSIVFNYSKVLRHLTLISNRNLCNRYFISINNNQRLISSESCLSFNQFENYSINANSSLKCWKCNKLLNQKSDEWGILLFCDKCNAIQELDRNTNYFSLFGIEVGFDVDLRELSKTLKTLQKSAHPDKFSQKSFTEHQYSVDNSSLINNAYKTLSDPYERGQYLLDILFGSPIQESETDIGIDTQFLTNIMNLNEDIADSDASEKRLLDILQQNEENMKNLINQISIAFKSKDSILVKKLLAKLKFYNSAALNLKAKLEKYA